MPAPAEIPGFYFDPEKNRYFPLKKWAPGSAQRPSSVSSQNTSKSSCLKPDSANMKRKSRFSITQLLSMRQIGLNSRANSRVSKCALSGVCNSSSFEREYAELQTCFPKLWKYSDSTDGASGDLEHILVSVQTPQGTRNGNFLIAGSQNGSLRFYEVGNTKENRDRGMCKALPLLQNGQSEPDNPPFLFSKMSLTSIASGITCIKKLGDEIMFTTLGSGMLGASICFIKAAELVERNQRSYERMVTRCISINSTIWTADVTYDGSRAVIGTNEGARLLDLDSGSLPWICHSNSDNLSQKFDGSGNLVFCGFRNGTILTVDTRQNSRNSGEKHKFPRKFRVRGNLKASDAIHMPSAVCGMVPLRSDENYLLASSMDGTVKLWDRRLSGREAVQSYEGQVNSHTMLQIGVDPSETFVVAGGEDSAIRLWGLKSGKPLFTAAGATSPVRTICWPRFESSCMERLYENSYWGFWLGCSEELLYMSGGA
eukprot:TRINITY_DN18783_c0_g1_i1.p1 TRINITY_DN18783_c0_g1~~TRINITY_DN18783_c0_g1_i1.p1  ORF type:complete len:484 (+),score=63.03 TRINITY_DN18783_c0_g1_i1:338-1789(+)